MLPPAYNLDDPGHRNPGGFHPFVGTLRSRGNVMASILRLGSTGPDVTKLQKALNQAGKSARPKLLEDGSFGQKTLARVIEFQQSRRLAADGVAGPATQAALGMTAGAAGAGGGLGGGASTVGGIAGGLVSDVLHAVN